jgi:hypothetical protein
MARLLSVVGPSRFHSEAFAGSPQQSHAHMESRFCEFPITGRYGTGPMKRVAG